MSEEVGKCVDENDLFGLGAGFVESPERLTNEMYFSEVF